MVNFRPIMVALILFGLFSIALINGALLLPQANLSNQSIADHPSVRDYADELNKSLDKYKTDVKSSEEAISEAPTSIISDNIILDAIGGIWRTLKTVPTTIFNITTDFIGPVLFSGPFLVVIGVISAILTLSIIIAVWKLVFTGEGG